LIEFNFLPIEPCIRNETRWGHLFAECHSCPCFRRANLFPRKRGAGIQPLTGVSWTPACAGVTSRGTNDHCISFSNINKSRKEIVTVHGANVSFYVIARSAFDGPWQSQSLHFRLLRRKTPRNDPKNATCTL